jgi:hypothetical protein
MTSTNTLIKPATIPATDAGVALRAWEITAGMYIWHKGSYRVVTSVEPVGASYRIRMGRYSITTWLTLEVYAS